MSGPTVQQQLGVLAEQQSAITQALQAMLEGRWTGEASLEAWLLALDPTWAGQLESQTPLYTLPDPEIPLDVRWIGSPNHYHGRAGFDVCAIVIHTMGGSLAGCDSWFQNSAAQVSSHYGIGLEGQQHQYVRLFNGSWANGFLEPGNTWPGPPGNPNYQTVTIETEDLGNPHQVVTEAQYSATFAVAEYALEIFPSITWLLGHHCISPQSRANCCGARWRDSGKFERLAAALDLEARY